jgi:crooked neck
MATRDARDRAPRVKNRAPAAVQVSKPCCVQFFRAHLADIQITAEQILREAHDRQEIAVEAPKQRIQDLEELQEYQGRKRTEFEGRIRYNRDAIIGEFTWCLLRTDPSMDPVRYLGGVAE